MSIHWFSEGSKDLIATIADTNITLNKPICNLFTNANKVMLGIDKQAKTVCIKPISKDQVMRGDIPQTHLYNITIRSSYARISNKDFILQIKKSLNISDLSTPLKYDCKYDKHEDILTISLEGDAL